MNHRIPKIFIIFLLILNFSLVSLTPIDSKNSKELSLETAILFPSIAHPLLIQAGDSFTIEIINPEDSSIPEIFLVSNFITYTLIVIDKQNLVGITYYIVETYNHFFPFIYDLEFAFSSTNTIVNQNSVCIKPGDSVENEYTFIHITDIHLDGTTQRTNQISLLFDEINLINPDFVILTGDLIAGLTSINNQIIAGETQFLILFELLQKLRTPIFIINGNHDFRINNFMNGIELWEFYFLPIEYLVQFTYKDSFFVGASTYDYEGLTSDQSTRIINAFRDSNASLKIFFAHSDYENGQFHQIYSQGAVSISLLGHEHSSRVDMVDQTVEIVTDNSIILVENEPGHYRLCKVINGTLDSYDEIESLRLMSNTWKVNQSEEYVTLLGYINISNNYKKYTSFVEEITLDGHWAIQSVENISNYQVFFNGTQTLLRLFIENKTSLINQYEVKCYLIEKSSTSSNISSSTQLSTKSELIPSSILTNQSSSYSEIAIILLTVTIFGIRKKKKR